MSLIEIENFSYSYPASGEPALSSISLCIGAGEFVAVIGANNSGKSTLCYALSGVVPHLYQGKAEGSVKVCGNNTADTPVADLIRSVALVMQKPEHQLSGVRFSVAEEVAFSLENMGVERDEIKRRVDEALNITGLSGVSDRSPHHLSGGQLQRTVLASALVCDTPVLVLDEPTTFLDPAGAGHTFEILSRLRDQGKAVVLVEQRLESIALHADRVIALHRGRIVLDGPPEEVLTSMKLKDIGLDWNRFTRVAHLAVKNGLWGDGRELATTLKTTVDGLKVFREVARDG